MVVCQYHKLSEIAARIQLMMLRSTLHGQFKHPILRRDGSNSATTVELFVKRLSGFNKKLCHLLNSDPLECTIAMTKHSVKKGAGTQI